MALTIMSSLTLALYMNEQIKEIGILQPRKKPFPCHFLISESLSFLPAKRHYDNRIVTKTFNVMETNALP